MSNGSPSDRPWEQAQHRLLRAVDRLEAVLSAQRSGDELAAQEATQAENMRLRRSHDVLSERLDVMIARVRAIIEDHA